MVSIQFMEAHSRSGTVKSRGGTGGNSRSRGRGAYIKRTPSVWGLRERGPGVFPWQCYGDSDEEYGPCTPTLPNVWQASHLRHVQIVICPNH